MQLSVNDVTLVGRRGKAGALELSDATLVRVPKFHKRVAKLEIR